MASRSINRTGRAMRLFLLAMVAAFLIPVATASAADKVANPGSFKAEIVGGELALKNGDKEFQVPISELQPAPTLQGTVTSTGQVTIPPSGVQFSPLILDFNGSDVKVFVISSGTDWTGTIDPDSGAFDLNARLRIKIEGNPGIDLGGSCYVGAAGTGNNIHLNPATTGTVPATGIQPSLTGVPYDSEAGTTTVVNNTVSVPAASGCGPLSLADGTLNSELGLPSPSGNNLMSLELKFTENAPQPPAVARYTADPEQGRIPFDVDFDASATTSTLGPIDEYRWDFDGDGVDDTITTEPTVTHTYGVAGVYPTRLTISTQGYETARSRATVTARSIVTTFNEKPDAFSQNRNVNFAFTSNEPGTFQCQLQKNGSVVTDWETCVSPVSYPEMEDADYKFSARAIPTGETDPGLPAVWDFRVDNVAPSATITSRPPNFYNQLSFPVAFTASEPESSFECRVLQDVPVDPEAEPTEPVEPEFEPCVSGGPIEWAAVEGPVTVEVRATDRAGNLGAATSATWTIDLTPPISAVPQGPPSPTNKIGGTPGRKCSTVVVLGACLLGEWLPASSPGDTSQGFTLTTTNEPEGTYVCSFNGGEERPCITGMQTGTGYVGPNEDTNLRPPYQRTGDPVQGTNTLRVWAVDRAGNRQTNPTLYNFVYDTVPPVLVARTKPADYTKAVNNTVIFESNEAVTKFECRIVNNTGSGTTAFANNVTGYVPCDPGMLTPTLGWYTVSGQTEGRKGVQIRATDMAGNTQTTNDQVLNNGGLTVYWVVDNTAPAASFAAGTVGQGSYTTSTSATVNLSATDTPINFGVTTNGTVNQQPTYECSLNGASFSVCTTPINLTGLTPGAKSFRVRVTDKATNVSAIVERNWTVVNSTNASVTLNSKPADVIGVRTATYDFTPSSGTSECRIDPSPTQNETGTGWVACTSPYDFTGLQDGNHQVEIRANNASVPVVHNFAVYANAPTVTLANQPGIARPDGKRYTGLADESASPTFTAPANPAYAPGATTFECRYYETSEVVGPWETCASPFAVNWDKTDNGAEMKLDVRPISSTGIIGTVQSTAWTIDAVRPVISWGNPGVATACGNGALNGPGPAGCVATSNSTQPWIRTTSTTPQFRATSTQPIPNSAAGFACQLNSGAVQNPCTGRTSSPQATGNPLTVTLGGSRGTNSDAFGTAITQNASNTLRVWAVDNGGNLSTDPVTYTFVHDSAVPTFAITSPTPARTNAGTVDKPLTVAIESNEDMHAEKGFACRIISGGSATTNGTSPGTNPNALASGWATCPMDLIDDEDPGAGFDLRHASWTATNLAEGTYALDIRGWDTVWNVATGTNSSSRPNEANNNTNGRRYVFTIDRTAPTVNITAGPANGNTVPQTGGQFAFAPSEPAGQISQTECRLDPVDPGDVDTEDWTACSGTFDFSDLSDGAHTFQVRSLDTAGNQGNPTTRTWTVDSTMPEITLNSNLNGPVTNQTAAQFQFTVTPVDSTLECRLLAPEGYPEPLEEGEEATEPEFAPCTSPVDYADLIDGEYTIEIKATNTLGTVGEIASKSWTVDTVVPVASISSGPSAPTKSTSAEFAFGSDKSGSTFECQLDSGTAGPCTSPKSYTGLDDGAHTIKVRATDPAGNVSEWTERSWSVDTVVPVTTISSGPTGTVESKSASIQFTADKAGSTFECKMDAGNWAACTSPKTFSDLSNGLHQFRVRATDTLGNIGEPAGADWAVYVPPCPTGQIGTYPNCQPEPCPTGQIGTPPNCQPEPCPTGQVGTPPNCQPEACPTGEVGTPPNCQKPVTTCEAGQLGKFPDCKTPLPTIPGATPDTGAYNPATGKLAIRLKCPANMKPACIGNAVAVDGKGKKAKVMSSKVKNTSKAGKWKLVTLTIKPAYREKVALMSTVDKKQLIIKQTLRTKKQKKNKTVFHTYKVRNQG